MDATTIERPAGAEQKAWGWAQELWRQTYRRKDGSEAVLCRGVRVFIRQGGYSSIHLHANCMNVFSVRSGQLTLRSFSRTEPTNQVVEFVQEPTDMPASFGAGRPHQFEALTDVEALEIYIATEDGDAAVTDITRFTENGCK